MSLNFKENKRTKIILSYLSNVIILLPILFYGGQNFTIDSYGISLDYNVHINAFLGSYRWFGALAYKVYNSIFGHNPITDSKIDCIVFIIVVAAIISALSFCICNLIGEKSKLTYIAINLSVILSIANVWFLDILSFPECVFITAVGVVLCFSAIITFVKSPNIKGYILSAVLIILATGIYQQFLFIFTIYIVAICSVQIYKNNEKTFLELLKRYIKPVILILSSGVIYFIIGKLVQSALDIEPNERVATGISTIFENCIYFATHQHSYLKGRGYFDSEILTVCFLLLGALWSVVVFVEWLKNKNTIKTILICISYGCAYVSAYAPGILSTSHASRAMFAVFSVFALFAVGSLVLLKKSYIKVVLSTVLAVVLIANICVAVRCELNLKKQNDADQFWTEQVISEIEKYENDGTKIEKIYYCYDSNIDISQYTESAVCYDYSLRSMINYYSGRDFNVEEMPEKETTGYFNNKNWEEFNEEQIVFVGDTMYLCCY